MRQFNEDDFFAEQACIPWNTAFIYDDVDELWDHWAKLYNDVLDILYMYTTKDKVCERQPLRLNSSM